MTVSEKDKRRGRATVDAALSKKLKPEELENIRAVFDNFDKDKSGKLELSGLKALCTELGGKMTDSQLTSAMTQLDKYGNGKVDFDEFVLFWTTTSSLGGY